MPSNVIFPPQRVSNIIEKHREMKRYFVFPQPVYKRFIELINRIIKIRHYIFTIICFMDCI